MTDVGRFMFGVGAIVLHPDEKRILVLKRSKTHSDFNKEKWEVLYGRKAQFENIEDAIKREALEEIGVSDIIVGPMIRMWHFFRGEKSADTEILGATFLCYLGNCNLKISSEHSEFRWVTPEESLDLISVPGIIQDIRVLIDGLASDVFVSNIDGVLKRYIKK